MVCSQDGKFVNVISIPVIRVIIQQRFLYGGLAYGPRDKELSKAQAFTLSYFWVYCLVGWFVGWLLS
jgi:hypothetical protein